MAKANRKALMQRIKNMSYLDYPNWRGLKQARQNKTRTPSSPRVFKGGKKHSAKEARRKGQIQRGFDIAEKWSNE